MLAHLKRGSYALSFENHRSDISPYALGQWWRFIRRNLKKQIPLWNTMFCTFAKAHGSSQSWPTTVKHGLCHPVRQCCQWTFYPFQPNTPPIKWIVTSLHATTSIARKTLIPCCTYLCKKFIIYDDLFSWCIYVESVESLCQRCQVLTTSNCQGRISIAGRTPRTDSQINMIDRAWI